MTDEAITKMIDEIHRLEQAGSISPRAVNESIKFITQLAHALDDHKDTEAKLRSALDLLVNNIGYTGKVAKAALAGADLRDRETLQKVVCGTWENPNV